VKYDIKAYRGFVDEYKNCKSREVKRELQRILDSIKNDFRTEINKNDPKVQRLSRVSGELFTLLNQTSAFELTEKEKKDQKAKKLKLEAEITKLTHEIEDIKSNAIYKNAFEWRFEFPEVLNNNGDFEGFDVVVGNPPYGAEIQHRDIYKFLYPESSIGQIDTYKFFIDLCIRIVNKEGISSFITSDSYLEKKYFQDVRMLLDSKSSLIRNIKLGDSIFDGINLPTSIFLIQKGTNVKKYQYKDISHISNNFNKSIELENETDFITLIPEIESSFTLKTSILSKENTKSLIEIYDQVMGVKVYQIGKGKPKQTSFEIENNTFISKEKKNQNYYNFISQGIGRYTYKSKDEWINYGEWLAEPRDVKYFENPKVIIREIVNPRIFATYIEYPAVVKNIAAVIIQKDPRFSLKYLLALLNSKLLTYYLYEQTPKSSNKSYPSFTSELIKNIPIKDIPESAQQPFITLVDQILAAKQAGEDTSVLEGRIDELVYALYGLTEEEIAVVEG
jgi:adenine-specific DNA-methyltransferase